MFAVLVQSAILGYGRTRTNIHWTEDSIWATVQWYQTSTNLRNQSRRNQGVRSVSRTPLAHRKSFAPRSDSNHLCRTPRTSYCLRLPTEHRNQRRIHYTLHRLLNKSKTSQASFTYGWWLRRAIGVINVKDKPLSTAYTCQKKRMDEEVNVIGLV